MFVSPGANKLGDDVVAVGAGVDFLQAATFNDAEHGGGPGATVFGADKEPSFAADGDGANGALGDIIFHGQEAVF